MGFVGELVDGIQDGVGAVAVDEVDEGLEVASGGVVGGVVLQFAPGGEQDEFRVCGAAAALEVAGCEGELGQLVLAAGEGDAAAGGEQAQDLGHGADVGPAQHRRRVGEGADVGGEVVAAGQA